MKGLVLTLILVVRFGLPAAIVPLMVAQPSPREPLQLSERAVGLDPLSASPSGVQTIEIYAIDSGWYTDTGNHKPAISNYLVGECASPQCIDPRVFRNFFVFDLAGIPGQVLTASPVIENPENDGYVSNDPSETWTAHDVTTPISALVAGGSGLTEIYDDLGEGTHYGSATVTPASVLVHVRLNDAAISALNAATGDQFAIGGAITTLDAEVNREWVFGNSTATHVRKLVLSVCSPTLAINYSSGRPGSFFTLTGSGFPHDDTATIIVNGLTLTDTLSVDSSGGFVFLLDTSQADAGYYSVTALVNPSAMTSFALDPNLPLRPQEGSGPILDVPSGIAWKALYVPLILR
jgi:hypothetical protein